MIVLDIEDVNVNECFAVKLRNLFNLNDFLYSFLFGFVPSLADIVTDFTFTSRLAKIFFILVTFPYRKLIISQQARVFWYRIAKYQGFRYSNFFKVKWSK